MIFPRIHLQNDLSSVISRLPRGSPLRGRVERENARIVSIRREIFTLRQNITRPPRGFRPENTQPTVVGRGGFLTITFDATEAIRTISIILENIRRIKLAVKRYNEILRSTTSIINSAIDQLQEISAGSLSYFGSVWEGAATGMFVQFENGFVQRYNNINEGRLEKMIRLGEDQQGLHAFINTF